MRFSFVWLCFSVWGWADGSIYLPTFTRFPQQLRPSCFSRADLSLPVSINNILFYPKGRISGIGYERESPASSVKRDVQQQSLSPLIYCTSFYECCWMLYTRWGTIRESGCGRIHWLLVTWIINHKLKTHTHTKKIRWAQKKKKNSRFHFLLLPFSLCPKNFTTAIEQLVSLARPWPLYTHTNIYKGMHSPLLF